MRKYVAPFVCAVIMVGTAVMAGGCTAEASFHAGGAKQPETKPVEPAPTAPATTPAPEQKKPVLKVEDAPGDLDALGALAQAPAHIAGREQGRFHPPPNARRANSAICEPIQGPVATSTATTASKRGRWLSV